MKVAKVVELVESKIEDMLRDERVLNMVSKNINTAVKVQNYAHKRMELVLRLADIPTLKSLNELFLAVNHLEKENIRLSEKVQELEARIAKNEKPLTVAKKKVIKQ